MERKYIDILYNLGESLILDEESSQTLTSIDEGYYINYIVNWERNNTILKLLDIELVNVFKGLIIAEQCYTDLCGSASVGSYLYQEIEKRRLDNDLQIANWAYIKTNNGYIPFGSNGSIRSRSNDVNAFKSNWKAHSRQIHFEKNNKREKLLREKKAGLKKRKLQAENHVKEQQKRIRLSFKPNNEIANIIIKDPKKSIYYYCYLIERIINDKSIDKQLLKKILERFKTKEKKNTKILKYKLIEEINKR
jgi:hypothetical protein